MAKPSSGFTLAELLIALAITGAIAAFSIPKIVNAAQSNDYKYRVQMAAAMIASAYTRYREDNTVTGSFKPSDLTPYMNYVKMDTSGTQIDYHYSLSGAGGTCSGGTPCALMANGARIRFYDLETFGSIAPAYAVIYQVDPDGVLTSSGTTDGPGKMIELYLYATNGRVADRGSITNPTYCAGTASCVSGRTPSPGYISPWFSWD